jgi:hypothetical protein
MRCRNVGPLVERYVDGTLDGERARQVKAHLPSCDRCSQRVEAARMLLRVMAAEPGVKAPAGFAARVMEAVYRQPLSGPVSRSPATLSPMYRRLGLSFVLTAAVLVASLFIPRASYPYLFGGGDRSAGPRSVSALTVENVIHGADNAVRGILGEQVIGGTTR